LQDIDQIIVPIDEHLFCPDEMAVLPIPGYSRYMKLYDLRKSSDG